MPTTQNNRPILDLKQWEFLNPVPFTYSNTTSYGTACSDHVRQIVFMQTSASTAYLYNPYEDSWALTKSLGGGSWGSGGAVAGASAWSTGSTLGAASLTATGGTTTTIVTNQSLIRSLKGFPIHIMEGPNAGAILTISDNTIGANATITVPAQASAFNNTTKYRLGTPVFWSGASSQFRRWDWATDTTTAPSQTNFVAANGNPFMVVTPSWIGTGINAFATGTATGATGTTLANTGKAWATNQWTNYQVRITAGTGAGQIRTISSNTATTLTVPTWTTTPDNTSQYSIEGNDDFLYVIGEQSTSDVRRYSISANTWTQINNTRPSTASAGNCAFWMGQVSDAAWNVEDSIINGRRIYAARGSVSNIVDIYDIPSNTWLTSQAAPVPNFSNRYHWWQDKEFMYATIADSPTTGKPTYNLRINAVNWEADAWCPIPNGLVTGTQDHGGQPQFVVRYRDGATTIPYVYIMCNNTGYMIRTMLY